MIKVLVDSSVWIDFFNGKSSKADVISDLIDNNSICTNDLILTELIPFVRKSGEIELVELLKSISKVKMVIDWPEIIEMQFLNLKKGLNNIGIPDLIILQNVIQNDLYLLSFDKHFKAMSEFHKFHFYGN